MKNKKGETNANGNSAANKKYSRGRQERENIGDCANIIRPLLLQQQGAVIGGRQGISREWRFGVAVNKHYVLSVFSKYRECASKSCWPWLEGSSKGGIKLCDDRPV